MEDAIGAQQTLNRFLLLLAAIWQRSRYGALLLSAIFLLSILSYFAGRHLLAASLLLAFLVPLLCVSPSVRFSFLVIGGLISLSSSNQLNLVKDVYLAGVTVAVGAAIVASFKWHRRRQSHALAPLLVGSCAVLTVAVVSLPVAISAGNGFAPWLRDVAPYLLFAIAPLFVIDFEAHASRSYATGLFLVAATLSGISFGLQILQQRHVEGLPLSHLTFASLLFPAALFSFAIARWFRRGARSLLWLAISLILLLMLLATGTRSILVLLVAPCILAWASRGQGLVVWTRLGLLVAPLIVLFLLAASLGHYAGRSESALIARLESAPGSLLKAGSDWSLVERANETSVAWQAFQQRPIVGFGPGHTFFWRTAYHTTRSGFDIDTPLSFLAKFGLTGVLALLAVGYGLVSLLRGSWSSSGGLARTALLGYLGICCVSWTLFVPLEDKGVSFGFAFILLLGCIENREFATSSSGLPTSDVGSTVRTIEQRALRLRDSRN